MNLMGSAATEGRLEHPLGKENRDTTPKNSQGLFTYVNPFEQLAASSPRIRTPKNGTTGVSSGPSASVTPAIQILKRQGESADNKRKLDERMTMSSPAHSKRKLDATSQISSGPPTPLPDGRTQLEALIGIGAPNYKERETVSNALNEVGDQVDKQVQEAIARAEQDESQAIIEKDMEDMLAAKPGKEFEEAAQIAAQDIKEELEKEQNSGALDSLPTDVADAVKDIIDDTAQGHIADSWESADAEDSPVKEEEEPAVKVYNFPMKPWTSVTIKDSEESRPTFRDDIVSDIARLKKDFDQIDRTLVTASNNYIVYGMSKNGGFRIIRQDDGKDVRIFTETHDRIFNVVTSSSAPDLKEAVIGTGISGTVYWALVKDGKADHIEDSHPEFYGFALPPIPALDSESPGGVLKTRARKSANHPDFFAVGRGKSIHIIWPSIVMKSFLKHGKDRIVDTEKYLSQHCLKVNTGKAGKDFTFSEDDTTIVSLDKAGRVKFWDVRPLTETDDHGKPVAEHTPLIEIKEPLVTFTTTPATEKSWPTSVLFVDKLRPYQRGGALRYLIVGMKQNHTLQLWDLALGKPVQEIHLPHAKESDAVCSVMYHAATGMLIIGHPTRNSIYFLHLSAPKYNLPKNITQAQFMQNLVSPDPSIPKPDSTAVISGMREYSFASKGSLRSLDILQTPSSAAAALPGEPTTMFELYAMHSKGVTCLAIKQADLGWTLDNKVLQPVVALEAGVISIDTLKEISAMTIGEANETTPQSAVPTRIVPRPTPKEAAPKETSKKASHVEASTTAASSSKADEKAEKKDSHHNGGFGSASGAEKSDKKKRRKATNESHPPTSTSAPQHTPQHAHPHAQSSKPVVLDPLSNARNGSASKASVNTITEVSGAVAGDSHVQERFAGEVKKLIKDSLDSLYQNIKDDRRTQAAVADAKQDAMLRLVSSTLSDNIEQTLGRIVTNSIQQSVLPAISDVALKAVNEQVGSKLNSHLSNTLPKELQKALPDVIGRALQQPQLLKLMAESLATSVSFRVEEHFATTLQNVVTPAFKALATQTAQRVAADVQREAEEQIGNLERQTHADSMKIDQLIQLVTGLSETVSTMAGAQTEFQGQFLKMQQQLTERTRQSQASGGSSSAVTKTPEKTPQQLQYEALVEEIVADLQANEFQDAILRWLKSGLHQEVFEGMLCRYSPNFIRELAPIYLIAVGSVVSDRLEGEAVLQRLAWMDTILQTLKARATGGEIVS
jgi:WD40 repeat protein